MPRFGILNPKSRDFKSRFGGCEKCIINGKLFSKNRPEDRNDPQPDPSVQPKARGLLHMEREYITHHIRRRNSWLEHLIASTQPEKHSKDYSRHSKDSKPEQWIPEALESTRWTSLEVLNTCRTRLRRALELVRPGAAGLPTGIEYLRVGSSTWLCPTSFISTRTGVELVNNLGN